MGTESSAAADAREEQILRAAFQVFTAKGFHGATMLDVATAARASKATLYDRFRSKAALFEALVAWGVRQGVEALGAVADDPSLAPQAALERFAERLLVRIMAPQSLALFRIAAAEGARWPEVGRIFDRLTREHGVDVGRAIAARLVAAGTIAIDDPDDFGHAFIGLLQGELFTRALLGAIAPPSAADLRKHARRATRRLLRAFAPR